MDDKTPSLEEADKMGFDGVEGVPDADDQAESDDDQPNPGK